MVRFSDLDPTQPSYYCGRIGGLVNWKVGKPCPECGDKLGHGPAPDDACTCGEYGAKAESHACPDNLLRKLYDQKARIAQALELLNEKRCSDHGCMFGHAGGMGTNGGCRHDKMTKHELRREFRPLIKALRAALAD
jgi:hypothetical protein